MVIEVIREIADIEKRWVGDPPDGGFASYVLHHGQPLEITEPRNRTVEAIKNFLMEMPPEGTPAAEMTEGERCAMAIRAGAPYVTEMDGTMMRLRTTVPVGVADRPGGGYIVAIGTADKPGDTMTVRLTDEDR
jgi:hypothetical protein